MAIESADETKAWYEKFWLVSLLAFLLSLVLLLVYYQLSDIEGQWVPVARDLLHEAGFACLIAFFLNVSIEWVNRRRHSEREASLVKAVDEKHQQRIEALLAALDKKHEETSRDLLKDVFRTVYERNIEPGVFKVVDDHVLKKDLMRKGYKLSMKISPLADRSGASVDELVDLTFYIQYDAVNLTDRPYEGVLLSAQIDITPEHEDKCQFIKVNVGNRSYSSDELEELIDKDEKEALWTLKVPGQISRNGSVPVFLEYRKVGPRNYSEVVCSTVQMDSLELNILQLVPGLKVNALSLHPENEVRTSPEGASEFTAWKINHAILPGQGAVVFWHPHRPVANASPANPVVLS